MSTPSRCVLCRFVLASITCGWTMGVASAQSPHDRAIGREPFSVVRDRVPVGGVVYVTDAAGITIKGKLAALTDDSVQVDIGAGIRSVAAAQVRHIQWQQSDSLLTGVMIGAAVGAIPGIYWLAVDPNECTGMCPQEYGLVAIGALVGGAIDLAIKRRVTVYATGVASGRGKIAVSPIVVRDRQGVRVVVKF